MTSDQRDAATSENFDAFALLFAIRRMQLNLTWGRIGYAYGWILWSVRSVRGK